MVGLPVSIPLYTRLPWVAQIPHGRIRPEVGGFSGRGSFPDSGHWAYGQMGAWLSCHSASEEPLSCSGHEGSMRLEPVMAFTSLCSELPEKGIHPASSCFVGPCPLGTQRGRGENLAATALKGDPNRTVTPSFPEQKSKRG